MQKHFQISLESYIKNPESGENVIESIEPAPGAGITYPQEGLTTFFGKRFAAEAMTQAAREARRSGERLVPVVVTVNAWRPSDTPHWFDTWEGKTAFDLRRLKNDIEHEHRIRDLWKQYLMDDGASASEISDMDIWNHQDYLQAHPEYIDRLRREKEFRDIDVFIWGAMENGKQVCRATLYNAANVASLKAISAEPVKLALPKWLKKTKAKAKLQIVAA